MKSRYLWIILGVAIFLATVVIIDKLKLSSEKDLQVKEATASTTQGSINLRTCDQTQTSLSGPLVPDQGNTELDADLSEITAVEKIPESTWSTRAGFGISTSTDPYHWAQLLGSGWYIDWSIRTEHPIEFLEHWQMVRVHEDCISPSVEEIRSTASRYPGQVWIIGNEPDVIWQDNITAGKYAATYHELYQLIKTSDPSSLIAIGGVSQSTPLRLQYLDQVLHAYQDLYHGQLPLDWWTVHGYVLREEKGSWGVDIPPGIETTQGELREVEDHGRIDLFELQLRTFRQWMEEHGYQDTPLALTEFGILMPSAYGFPSEVVISYLEQTFAWLLHTQDEAIGYPEDGYRLVQKWAWFSIADPTYSSSNLGDLPSGKLTLVGESFRNVVISMNP